MMSTLEVSPITDVNEWVLLELAKLGVNLSKAKLKKISSQIERRSHKPRAQNIFGSSIITQLQDENEETVPLFLKQATSFLLPFLDHKCLFRKRGQDGRMKHLKEHIESGGGVDVSSHPDDVAGLLKAWIRELPVPVLPNEFHELFLSCHEESSKASSSKPLLCALTFLPRSHLTTLKFILQFLHKVEEHSSTNGMNSESLSVVFAPNLFPGKQIKAEKASAELLREQEKKERDMIKWLIEHSEEVSRLPESVSQLASLTDLGLESSGENFLRRKKRRKSIGGFSDFVGSKIKKMVAAEKAVTPNPKDTLAARRRSVRRSLRGNAKRLLSSGPLERQTATPRTFLAQHLDQTHLNSTRKDDKHIETRVAKQCRGLKPCCSPCVHCNFTISPENTLAETVYQNPPVQAIEVNSCKSVQSPEVGSSTLLDDIPDPGHAIVIISDNEEKIIHQIQNMMPDIESQNPGVEIGTQDMENEDQISSTFTRSVKRSLKRGQPNTIGTGLKSSRKAKGRRSNSSVSHKIRLNSIRSSARLQRSSRRSCSNSNVSGFTVKLDKSGENGLFSDELVPKKLSFTTETPLKETISMIAQSNENLYCSFGFSPVLEGSKPAFKFSPVLELSKLDQSLLSPVDRVSPIQKSCPNVSLISSSEHTQSDQVDRDNLEPSTQPTVENSHMITMTSTPAKGIKWNCAKGFFQNETSANSSGEASKRDSIARLLENNKGRVLANIQLYNTILNVRNAGNSSVENSPATLLPGKGFNRNGPYSKSVREVTQTKDSQGFVVPRGLPTSVKRSVTSKIQPGNFMSKTPDALRSRNFNEKRNRSADLLSEREALAHLHSTSWGSVSTTEEPDVKITSTSVRRSPRLNLC